MHRAPAALPFLVALFTILVVLDTVAAETVWIEGESADHSDVQPHSWYNRVKPDMLSGGTWLGHWSDEKVGQVRYEVEIPKQAKYTLYLRANPVKASMDYRLDGGKWKEVPFATATDKRNVAKNGKRDLRFIGWIKLVTRKLNKAEHALEFRFKSDNHHHGAIDALTFTSEPFHPNGKTKPGEQGKLQIYQAEDSWAFRYPDDRFTDKAMLDLRHLNEAESGEHGFIRLSEDGNRFVRGDGKPIRFWSVVSYGWRNPPKQMDHHARFLAKLGVNMVRIHTNIADRSEGAKMIDVDQEKIDKLWRFIKACKDAGIYVTISPYWYHGKIPASWADDLAGYEKGDRPAGAMFFNPKLIDAYKSWVQHFYTKTNPYTGKAINEDPTVAVLQVKNEDSLLFWTSQDLPAPQVKILGRQYHDWLKQKYRSIDKAYEAWGGNQLNPGPGAMGKLGDAPDEGFMGLYIIWELTQDRQGGKAARLADQLEFLARTQHQFYGQIERYLSKTLGCKQLTNAMNWRTADAPRLGDAERWSYTATDVMAVNAYFNAKHKGEHRGYRVDPGDKLVNASATRNPLQMPTNLKQVAGAPMVITESAWVRPNLYQSEGALMTAAYMSLTGVDSCFWFATSEPDYEKDPRRKFWKVGPGQTGYALGKWTVATPSQQGMFPAAALLYRKGYVKQGEPVVDEHRPLKAIWHRRKPVISETANFDPNRDTQDLGYPDRDKLEVSRLAFLVGPVRTTYASPASKTRVADLERYVDAKHQIVRSNTGQIALDWNQGLFTLDAPKAKGVAGFLKKVGGKFKLEGMTITSDNDYAAIHVVAMDDKPIAKSTKLLVQVGTTNRLAGWMTRPAKVKLGKDQVDGREIVATGKPPFQIPDTKATLKLNNAILTQATLLDPAGYPKRQVELEQNPDGLTIDLPQNTMYLILH